MALVKVKNKYQVTLPDFLRRQIKVGVGDLLEAKVEKGKITLKPKAIVDRDEYTSVQRRIIDAQLKKALEEVKQGRVYGPFDTIEGMLGSLKGKGKNSGQKSKISFQ